MSWCFLLPKIVKGVVGAYEGKITSIRDNGSSADLIVRVQDKELYNRIINEKQNIVELDIRDFKKITDDQRKKAYACINDISAYTGYSPDEAKQVMKYYYISKTGDKFFSLADCSRDLARDFINVLIDFCLENGVQTSDKLSERTDDIDRYLWQCIKHRKCAACGLEAEIHHWDAIGMGNDRRTYDDSQNRKIALCRKHHTIAHQKGRESFQRDYHVYGIVYVEKCVDGEE
ncbi:MAG: hypothetical protein IIX45_10580 [Lachnospiraceae bacterium]|nr:hypothetical protein [Lachnospiraceae bacterium]